MIAFFFSGPDPLQCSSKTILDKNSSIEELLKKSLPLTVKMDDPYRDYDTTQTALTHKSTTTDQYMR